MSSFTTLLCGLLMAAAVVSPAQASNERLCSLPPGSYSNAKATYPDAAFALAELEKRGIATWYMDRESSGDYAETARQLVGQCGEDTRLVIVVYGLPNKDCDAGYSTVGSRVKTASDYGEFIGTLASIIGERKVLYVLEPDAVGLLANGEGGCAARSGYKANLETAIKLLTGNPNAEVYVDVGFWTLGNPSQTASVARTVRELSYAGRVKGIRLNTSKYRSNVELSRLCGNFQRAINNYGMHCIIDTSRNLNGPSPTNEWCNSKSAGIGEPPSSDTGFSNIDYFVWIKPPGESDGKCDVGRTSDAMVGPGAGFFFYEGFKVLWSQGYFVQQEHWPRIGEAAQAPTPAPTILAQTPTPESTPAQTSTPTPEPSMVPTPAPTAIPTAPPTPPPTTAVPPLTIQPNSSDSSRNGSSSDSGSSSSDGSSDRDDLWGEVIRAALQRNATGTVPKPVAVPTPTPTSSPPNLFPKDASDKTIVSSASVPLFIPTTLAGVAILVFAVVLMARTRHPDPEAAFAKTPRESV